MEEVKWTDDLSVGVDLIDEQHRTWIQHLNTLTKAVKSHQGATKISETLNFLADYTDHHFATEEKHMAETSYEGLEQHKLKHEEFKTTLANLEDDFREEGATPILADSIDTLLANWLVKHMSTVDQQFSDFLRENGIVITDS